MTINTQQPLAIFTGQAGQLRIVSKSHGAIRPNLVQSVDYTPKGSIKTVDEWDNMEPALLYQTFDGGSGKIAFEVNNQAQIEAALMDLDPTAAPAFSLDPAVPKPFTVAINHKDQGGRIVGASLLKGCLYTPVGFSGTVKDGAKGDISFQFLNGYRFLGLALQYNRATVGTAPQATPAAVTAVNATTTGFLVPGTYYIRVTAVVTSVGETDGSPEYGIIVPAGTNTNKLTVTTPAPAGSIASYNVYIGNRSGGERFVGNDAGASTLVITNLPALTAADCPNVNTTGAPQMTDDKVLAGSPYLFTFANAVHFSTQNGMGYALVLKNGDIVAAPNHPASIDTFHIKSDGTQFIISETPAATDWWDVFTLYHP